MSQPTTVEPRDAALAILERQHTHFVLTERKAWKAGNSAEAEGAHRVAIWLLRAYAAERDDPPPKFVP